MKADLGEVVSVRTGRRTGPVWTGHLPLGLEEVSAATDGPGLLVLIHGGGPLPERIVWAESCENVAARLADILSKPQKDEPLLAWWLARGALRFRAAPVQDAARRRKLLVALLRRAGLPGHESPM